MTQEDGQRIDLTGYVPVPERIEAFKRAHPDGSLQSEVVAWPTEAWPFVVVRAYAYRSPDDPRPGIGHAQEKVPGRTRYTRDSELQNAETSAWGRAIVAALAADARRDAPAGRSVPGGQRRPQAAPGPADAASEGNGNPGTAGSPPGWQGLDRDLQRALREAWGGVRNATLAAHERFGVDVLGALTRAQAEELLAVAP